MNRLKLAPHLINSSVLVHVAALFAAIITCAVLLPVCSNGFVDLDDVGYVIENSHITQLNWNTVVWAFTNFHEANWHPLTMLSLALDYKLWGLTASGFHVTNLMIHCFSTYLVCLVFFELLQLACVASGNVTGKWVNVVGSFTASVLFGIHPLRVESVAWVSERKDVLCLFFTVGAVWWYLRYAIIMEQDRSCLKKCSYVMMLLATCCALLSKPAAVSLPFVLLVLDWYPLARIGDRDKLIGVVKEKLLPFALVFATAILTLRAQQFAIAQAPDVDLFSRVLVACKALPVYLWKMLYPVGLAPYYPHPGRVTASMLPGFAVSVIAVCGFVAYGICGFRNRRFVMPAIGLFYLITLFPALGIIQVGGQWIADRYTYIPALGISLFWGGGAVWLIVSCWNSAKRTVAVVLAAVIICQLFMYAAMTRRQISVWSSTETLSSREIELFPNQAGAAYVSRSRFRKEIGQFGPALEDIDKALAIALRRNLKNKFTELSMARAEIFEHMGRFEDAVAAVDWAIQYSTPDRMMEILEMRHRLTISPEWHGR